MLLNEIRRLLARLFHSRINTVSEQPTVAAETASAFEFDPFNPVWHGDHWQNLLSSPMDARHYVMEDWSVSAADRWNEEDGVAPAH